MSTSNLHTTLQSIDLFSGLPDEVIAELVSAGVRLRTPAGQQVVQQGKVDAGLQVVLDGSAEVQVDGASRSPLGPGSYFGEISLIDGHPRSATVTAGESGLTTFAVSALKFSPLIDKYPTLARSLLTVLCARIRALEAAD